MSRDCETEFVLCKVGVGVNLSREYEADDQDENEEVVGVESEAAAEFCFLLKGMIVLCLAEFSKYSFTGSAVTREKNGKFH